MNLEQIIAENQTLKAELNTLQKRCEQYAEAYDTLQCQVQELLRYRFGKKSERYIDPEYRQLSLFDDNPMLDEMNEAVQTEPGIKIAAHTRKKKKAEKEIPVRIEIIPVSDADKHCGCGAFKTVMSYEVKKMLHHQPAVFEIIEQRREIVACPNKNCESNIITAPTPKHILPKVKATEEFLSFVAVSKIDDRQPLYHLEKQLGERYGLDCSRQTMARWMVELAEPLTPLINLFKDEVIHYDVASSDATTLQVLKEPGRAATTKSYVYCIRGGPPQKSVVVYEYNDKLHKQFVKDWFEGFKGYLHVDGDNFFDLVGEVSSLVHCNAHARRKFEPIALSAKKPGLAKQAMAYFKALYKIEREAKDNELTSEARYRLRQEKSKPLMIQFKKWLDAHYPTVLPQSPLGKAINYCLKLWEGLSRFLEDGRLEIDNNLTEQQIKPFVIARKNFLFCDTVDGAHALCLHFSLIRTAKLHGLDPYHYYVKLLKSIPHCTSVDDYEKLLPWNIKTHLSITITGN